MSYHHVRGPGVMWLFVAHIRITESRLMWLRCAQKSIRPGKCILDIHLNSIRTFRFTYCFSLVILSGSPSALPVRRPFTSRRRDDTDVHPCSPSPTTTHCSMCSPTYSNDGSPSQALLRMYRNGQKCSSSSSNATLDSTLAADQGAGNDYEKTPRTPQSFVLRCMLSGSGAVTAR